MAVLDRSMNWLLPHVMSEHVRLAVLESAEICWRAPHVVRCAVHVVLRWEVEVWYVLASHSEHVRSDDKVSADIL